MGSPGSPKGGTGCSTTWIDGGYNVQALKKYYSHPHVYIIHTNLYLYPPEVKSKVIIIAIVIVLLSLVLSSSLLPSPP